jgi:hypothetical protein
MKYNGDAEVSDLIKVTKISAINVEKVMTAEFTVSLISLESLGLVFSNVKPDFISIKFYSFASR